MLEPNGILPHLVGRCHGGVWSPRAGRLLEVHGQQWIHDQGLRKGWGQV